MTDWLPPAPPPVEDLTGNASIAPGQVALMTTTGGSLQVRRAALALPRDLGAVRRTISEMAEWGGDAWEYRFPVRSKGETQWIEGASIKCTNAVARAFGNCAIMTSKVDDIGDSWVIYSTFVDYQTGFELTRGFRQRKQQTTMRTDAGRAEDIVFQIGVSKSIRNVVNNALGDIVEYARSQARQRLSKRIGDDPDHYRERVRARLEEISYPLVKVEHHYNAKLGKWSVDQLAQVIKVLTAHADGVLGDLDQIYAPKGTDLEAEAKPNGSDASSSRPEPAGAPAAELGTETAAEAPPSAGGQQEPTAALPKRKPGRPSKAEAEARQQQAMEHEAARIIDEIHATDPDFIDDILETNRDVIADLPDHLRTEVLKTARDRKAAAPEDDALDDPGYESPFADEPEFGPEPDDGFAHWKADMEARVAGMPPDMRPGRKGLWLSQAGRWGERGKQAVEEAFAR